MNSDCVGGLMIQEKKRKIWLLKDSVMLSYYYYNLKNYLNHSKWPWYMVGIYPSSLFILLLTTSFGIISNYYLS